MKNEKIVSYKDIGSVIYRKNARARNISIRINSDGIVKVTVPGLCTFHRAENFVLKKSNWISQKLLKIKRNTEKNLVWKPGDILYMRNFSISIQQGEGSLFKMEKREKNYTIFVPEDYFDSLERYRETLFTHVANLGLKEAKLQLPSMLNYYSQLHKLDYERLTIRRMKTRWGSCSSKNSISLNSSLIFLSDELIEYVCLHELTHTVHKNHSQAFWNYLIQLLPDALSRRKTLRKMSIIA